MRVNQVEVFTPIFSCRKMEWFENRFYLLNYKLIHLNTKRKLCVRFFLSHVFFPFFYSTVNLSFFFNFFLAFSRRFPIMVCSSVVQPLYKYCQDQSFDLIRPVQPFTVAIRFAFDACRVILIKAMATVGPKITRSFNRMRKPNYGKIYTPMGVYWK